MTIEASGAGVEIGGPDCAEALEPAEPAPETLRRFGITRVGDITGLDTIGIPVWFAIRPNSRGLSVSQGKGITIRQARLSAIMEAIEGAVAEDTQRHVCEYGSVRTMSARHTSTVPLGRLSRVDVDCLDQDRERAWVRGFSVRTGEDVLAPYELIGLDFRAGFPWDRRAFHMSSLGLAAGFDCDRTILHALLELIEHDACFLIDAMDTRSVRTRRVSIPPGIDPSLDGLIDRLDKAELRAEFHDLTTGNGVPVVMASIERHFVALDGPGMRTAAGVACRLNPFEAVTAALLEAVQSRLTDISGARDDLSTGRYRGKLAASIREEETTLPAMMPEGGELISAGASGARWQHLAAHLMASGVEDIYVFPLESGEPGIKVARVLASGLSSSSTRSISRFSVSALNAFMEP
ncbi:YcaO-like family protein [Rhizobium daejeonense]|uniref:YcaO-like family protein n=1 Tax=Rhizobium daejeonense TaxID=240521 RepID=UPI001FEAE555|nr:YcaO-like family protein [Rhizobium daejeonense]